MYIHICAHLDVCICAYIYVHMCIYKCISAYIYIYRVHLIAVLPPTWRASYTWCEFHELLMEIGHLTKIANLYWPPDRSRRYLFRPLVSPVAPRRNKWLSLLLLMRSQPPELLDPAPTGHTCDGNGHVLHADHWNLTGKCTLVKNKKLSNLYNKKGLGYTGIVSQVVSSKKSKRFFPK